MLYIPEPSTEPPVFRPSRDRYHELRRSITYLTEELEAKVEELEAITKVHGAEPTSDILYERVQQLEYEISCLSDDIECEQDYIDSLF